MTTPAILLAGGGTGGHVYPLIAVADALRAERDVRPVFVGTARGIETRAVPARGYDLELLDVRPLRGGGASGLLRGAWKALASLPAALALIERIRPAALLSMGGYAAGPVSLAARLRGVPVALLEPNAAMGLANRWVLAFARRAYLVWPEALRGGDASRVREVGVPIREGFARSPYAATPGRFSVLVLGGSQGAAALNAAVPEAIARVAGAIDGLDVLHQAGRDRDDEVRARYAALGVGGRARVVPFLDDVAGAIAAADLVVARSGASAVAEIAAVGRAALFVPYPYAADDHQLRNAQSIARAGGALCLAQTEATPARLADELARLARDVGAREAMARAAGERGRPDAARVVARDLLELAGRPGAVQGASGAEARHV